MDFESKFYLTNDIYKKYVNKAVCFNIRFICGILLIISLGLMFISYNSEFYLFILVCFCFFVLLMIFILYPIIIYNNLIYLKKKIHSDKKYEAIVSFGNDIRLVEGKQKTTIDYKQISKIYEIDDLVVLMYTIQNGIIVDLNGLLVGDKKSFYKYILKKCKKVKKIVKRK